MRLVLGLVVAGAACGVAPAEALRNDYGQTSAWLCRPGRDDPCSADLTATVIQSDGTLTIESFAPDPNAPIDCFYIYPTVSQDRSGNSDMIPGEEEKTAALEQAGRFASVCRIYAPMYRQVTSTALHADIQGKPIPSDYQLALGDIVDAWRHYLAHDNVGRGVVLIGHSGGAVVLVDLLAREIDGKTAQRRLVSAIVAGNSVSVPRKSGAGGSFRSIPACRSARQTGCVISYASFRDTSPPPDGTVFGKPGQRDAPGPPLIAVCSDIPKLAGWPGSAHPYFPANAFGPESQWKGAWLNPVQAIATPFVTLPGLVEAHCESDSRGNWLSVHVNADPADPRTDDIPGDAMIGGRVAPVWGLHRVDMELVLGDLVELVRQQSAAYVADR
jgi:hypothetical protein